MNNFKKLKQSVLLLSFSAFVLTSCSDDDDESISGGLSNPSETVKSGILTSDEIWTSENVYELSGKVVVEAGITLTIEPGTIIKGQGGQGTTSSALIVAQGGTLIADGTSTMPIVFTSIADNISVGETEGTSLVKEDNQLWGGIIILGNAPISAESGDTESNIEGIPPEEGYGAYGGNISDDNSGSLSYVSIRHGGISIGDGNEINGLTLGGVGTGTEISNIEIYATLDDGIECFGGTVNISKALVFYQGDDGIDIDQNYSGTISDFVVIHGDGIGTDESLEVDGPEGSTHTNGQFTLQNGLCIIQGADGSAADFKSKAQGFIKNVTFQSDSKKVKFRTKFDNCTHKTDAYTDLVDTGLLSFIECNIAEGVKVYDGDADDENPTLCADELAASQTTASNAINQNGAGTTINPAQLFDWTCAGQRGEL